MARAISGVAWRRWRILISSSAWRVAAQARQHKTHGAIETGEKRISGILLLPPLFPLSGVVKGIEAASASAKIKSVAASAA